MIEDKKRTWTEVSTEAIKTNYTNMRKIIPTDCWFMGMVKSDAYGHGAKEISRVLENEGCDYLAVACLDEAEKLREAGIKLPILILGYTPEDYIERVVACGATQTLISLEAARAYSRVLSESGKTLKIHLKLETGMGRTGFKVAGSGVKDAVSALMLPGFEAEGVFTHFAAADEPDGFKYTQQQFTLFCKSFQEIESEIGKSFLIHHCANSAATILFPDMYLDMVRPGIALYGISPVDDPRTLELCPAMSLRSRITQVYKLEQGQSVSYGRTFIAKRPTRIAVLPIGYGDGLHRVLSGKMDVLVGGHRCPQVGRICMDMCMVDITDAGDVKVGDVATLFGDDGKETISVEEQAKKAGTISYEMFCSLSMRVPRLYVS